MRGKRKKSASCGKHTKRRRRNTRTVPQPPATPESDLVHPSVWFEREVAAQLWMPPRSSLQYVAKPSLPKCEPQEDQTRQATTQQRHATSAERPRAPEAHRPVESLLTSWYDITNYANVEVSTPWTTVSMPSSSLSREQQAAVDTLQPHEHMITDGEATHEST